MEPGCGKKINVSSLSQISLSKILGGTTDETLTSILNLPAPDWMYNVDKGDPTGE